MGAEIQQADPKERRKIILLCLIAVVAGGVLLLVCDMLIFSAAEDAEVAIQQVNIIIGFLFVLALPIIFISRTLWRIGRDTIKTRRFPPPGMKVIRDVVVVSGVAARRRGKLLQVFAILFVVLSIALPIGLWLLVWKLTHAV